MKSNDLRIGNWIYFPMIKNNYQIIRLDFDNKNENNYSPIPLTEDILLKCGFYQKNNLFILKDITLQLINCGTEIDNHLGFVLLGFNNEIKYVHQLQNLYFALTGEELTIKL